MKFREKFLKRLKKIAGKAVGFHVDRVRLPNGRPATREYLDHPGAVAVLPFIAPDKVIMVRQYRYPVDQITLEIPAGKLDKGESPLRCVKRELRLEEETGYKAGRVKKLLSFWPTASFANEVIHIYTADKLTKGRLKPDEDEFLGCEVWPLEKLHREIDRGRIHDAKTLIALLVIRARPGK